MGHYPHSNYVDWLVVIPYPLLLQPLRTPVSSCCLHSHVFQNGTCALSLQFAVLADICEVLCYRRSLRAEEIGDLFLRQPHGLVFKPHVQPDGLVRLIDDYLVLARSHSTLPLRCRGVHASRNSAHDGEGEGKRRLGTGFHRVNYTIFAALRVGFRDRFPWPRKVSVVRREQIRVLIKTAPLPVHPLRGLAPLGGYAQSAARVLQT